MDQDMVEKTKRTYEEIALEFNKIHSKIDEVKEMSDLFLQNLKGRKILDAGCGPGRDAKYFSENGFDVTGIDLVKNFVVMASKNAPLANIVQMDMRHIDLPKSAFDGVWASASLLHIPKFEAKATLKGFASILKSGGLLFVSVKEGAGEELVETSEYPGKKRFFAFWKESEFKMLLESCGFKIQKTIIKKKKYLWISIFAVKV